MHKFFRRNLIIVLYPQVKRSSDETVLSVDRSIYRWSDEDLRMMALWGNGRANAYISKRVGLTIGIGELGFTGRLNQICRQDSVSD
jgi:hypothetical protein